jgi:catechol-2,3-dioxygenase
MVEDTSKVIPPAKLAHVVLRTGRFKKMVKFYKNFLGANTTYENDFLCFLTYDDEHHRIALIGIPDLPPTDHGVSGLEHIAFTFHNLHDLLSAYQQRKKLGILPFWGVNHGPTTSIYYQDPDGNEIETQVDNFDTVEAANEFMGSDLFRINPIGTDFDPEELIQRLASGEDEVSLKKRREIGPRALSTVPRPAIPSC